MSNISIQWDTYTLQDIVQRMSLGDGSNLTLQDMNVGSCLLGLALREMGWPGSLIDRNLCTPSTPSAFGQTGAVGFISLEWKGQSLNAYGATFEKLRSQIPPSALGQFAGSGVPVDIEKYLPLLVLRSCQSKMTHLRAQLLSMALQDLPAPLGPGLRSRL